MESASTEQSQCGQVAEWAWEDAPVAAEMEWGEETRKRTRDGEAVVETWTIDIPYDVLVLVVDRVKREDLAWVRGVCRGLRQVVDRKCKILGLVGLPRKSLWGSACGVGRMREAIEFTRWKPHACYMAAIRGCLEVVQMVVEAGAFWGVGVCANAACAGHLHVLKWLRENGCPWDRRVCEFAKRFGQPQILEWVHDRPYNTWPCAVMCCEWARERTNIHHALLTGNISDHDAE